MILLGTILAAASFATDPVGSIGCIANGLGPEPIARIGSRIIAAADAGDSFDTSLDSERDAFIAARNACRIANEWTINQADMAVSYANASAALVGSEAALRTDGIDISTARGAYDSLTDVDRDSMVGGKSPTVVVRVAIDRIAATAKLSGTTHDKVLRHVTIYFSARAALGLYPAQFGGG